MLIFIVESASIPNHPKQQKKSQKTKNNMFPCCPWIILQNPPLVVVKSPLVVVKSMYGMF